MRSGFLPISHGTRCFSRAAATACAWKWLLAEPMPYSPASLVMTLRNTHL